VIAARTQKKKRSARARNYQQRNFRATRRADLLSPRQRSARMSLIRSRGTKFEQLFLHALSRDCPLPFETHVKAITGCPDIVFQEQKVCVFLDSDFWHGWQLPRWRHLLKNDFWRDKIAGNRRRDQRVNRLLRGKGWTVIRIWEHAAEHKIGALIQTIKSRDATPRRG
jgi:DNA mismatch endonuclease (patch repair protein)